uniref:Uncharacterized protein n=1 Tax=Cannabis sativa TaxID=3483 RepID=A0A803NPC9_CANSA
MHFKGEIQRKIPKKTNLGLVRLGLLGFKWVSLVAQVDWVERASVDGVDWVERVVGALGREGRRSEGSRGSSDLNGGAGLIGSSGSTLLVQTEGESFSDGGSNGK